MKELSRVALLALLALVAACGTRVDDASSAAPTPAPAAVAASPSGAAPVGHAGDASATTGTDSAADTAGSGGSSTATSAAASAAASTGSAGGDCAADTSPIRIGNVSTTSGLVGANGAGQMTGLRAWLADVNALGGIMCRPVELTVVDDQADPARHTSLKRQLIEQQHVTAFVGEFAPLTAQAGVRVSEEAGTPQIAGLSASKADFESPIAFPFQGSAVPESNALGLTRTLPEYADHKKAAIFYVSEIEFGNTAANIFQKSWEGTGGEIVLRQSTSLTQPDFTAEVVRAQSAGADTVYLAFEISACNRFWDAARRQHYEPLVLTNSSCYNDALTKSADVAGDHMISVSALEPPISDIPAVQAMRQAIATYEPQMNPDAVMNDGTVMRGWASGKLFEAVVHQAGGKTDSASLMAALHSMKSVTIDGLTTALEWPEGPHPERTCAKLVLFDGEHFGILTKDYLC